MLRLKSATLLLLVLGVSKLLALLSSVVIARSFDKDVSGLVFFLTGIVTLSVSITTLGLSASSSYYYARNMSRGRYARNWQTFNFGAAIAVVPSLLMAALALVMEEARGDLGKYIVPVMVISCFMAAMRQMAKMLFTIERRREWGIIHDSITYNVILILSILPAASMGPIAGLSALLVASVTSGVFAVWHIVELLTRRRGPFSKRFPPQRYAKLLLAISIPSMIAQGGAIVLNKIDVVMLGPLADAQQVGDYSVAMRLTYLAGMIAEVVVVFMAPRIIAVGSTRDPVAHWSILKQSFLLQVLAVSVISAPLMLYAKEVTGLLFGANYETAVPVYLVLQVGKLLTIAFAPSILLFTALGYNRQMAKVAVGVAIVNVLLNFVLIPTYGAVGTASATLISLCFMSVNYVSISLKIRRKAIEHRG